MTVDIEFLFGEKWLAIADDKAARKLRRFCGTRDECESVKADWLAGNFQRGTLSGY